MEIPTLNTPVTKCLALATFAGQMLSKYAATNAVLLELATKMFGAREHFPGRWDRSSEWRE